MASLSIMRRCFSTIPPTSNSLIPRMPDSIDKSSEISDDGWISVLNNRNVISVRGPDSTQFLQGIIANDMNLFSKEPERAAIYTCFLNIKGKVMFDAIIAKPLLAN